MFNFLKGNVLLLHNRKFIAGEKLRVEMRGIEYMNDDPGEVDVLYGRVNALSWSHSLQTIADSLVDEFVKAGNYFLGNLFMLFVVCFI